jgi:hypothetical protein
MRLPLLRSVPFMALLVAALNSMSAAAEVPKPDEILFERPHIASVPAGTSLVYKFQHQPSDTAKLGAGFDDNITVTIKGDEAPGKKIVNVQVYSGDRARDPQEIPGMDGNPMLIVFLQNAVSQMRQLTGGDAFYLKGAFRQSLTIAKIQPVKIDYKGQAVDGYEVVTQPYINDAAKARMNGFEGSTFTIALSDKIPGYFAQMVSDFSNSDKSAASLRETTTLEGVGGIK